MQLVADESCAGPVIRALRSAGHDVIAIAEISKGEPDERVMKRAFDERRVLVTEDRDFGELVYARRRPSVGVIFVKFDSRARRANLRPWSRLWQSWASDCGTGSRWSNPGGCGWPGDHQDDLFSQLGRGAAL